MEGQVNSTISLRQSLWRLAGFDPFLIEFCPTLQNRIASIGFHYLLQMVLLFAASWIVLLRYINLPFRVICSLTLALLFTFLYYGLLRRLTRWQQLYNGWQILTFISIVNCLLAFLMTIGFSLAIFQQVISFDYQLYAIENNLMVTNGIISDFRGLWYAVSKAEEQGIVVWGLISTLVLLTFCYILPYLLTFQVIKSYHITVQSLYEQKFTKRS
ncbi:hypothetical protein D0C36_23560 [Mucilaginibacter conchicola]|uniref:Uncharacterized protein n=1 Tax=Mucilaginibacter conchicola TaxID=2303333 RepID=A0A372NMC9_9SPHI|nr:hypothetical protein [Mucilaginibacter conchicola]RFZ90008.1 hypothetical protein D0C36_23560 [Mucilaginibacter conchicola]